MKKAIAVLVLGLVAPSVALSQLEKSPMDRFDGRKKLTETSYITWKTVPNVQQVCSAEAVKRGKGSFGYAIDACAFWDKTPNGFVCTIVTRERPNYWDLGHEMRHCFQGNWH
jgi:hypothetical protein